MSSHFPLLESWPEPDAPRAAALSAYLARWDVTPRHLPLFDQALTHASYAHENDMGGDNERLEFLGDTVLSFFVALWLYQTIPGAREGELSKRKASLVSRSALGRRARAMGLEELLRLGKGDVQSGAVRSSVLGSALEALAGAVFLDQGMEAARDFALTHIVQPCFEYVESSDFQDYKSLFQEAVQRRLKETPRYKTISETGPDHDKRFVVRALVGDRFYGEGEGRRKKAAENLAAQAAYFKFSEEHGGAGLTGSMATEPPFDPPGSE